MTSPIHEVRALLLQFERSPFQDLYLRSSDWTVFMARSAGAPNPMLVKAAEIQAVRRVPIAAPHLGIFEPLCVAGDVLVGGAVLGMIDVLGRKTEVVSEFAGRIAAIQAGMLVEFGDSLVDMEVAA